MSTDSVFVFSGLTPEGCGAKCQTPWKFDFFRTDSFVLNATDWTGGQPSSRNSTAAAGLKPKPVETRLSECGRSSSTGPERTGLERPSHVNVARGLRGPRLAGFQPQAESNSHCPGRETAVLVRWRFLPVVALIVRGVSSRNGLRRTRDRSRYPGGHQHNRESKGHFPRVTDFRIGQVKILYSGSVPTFPLLSLLPHAWNQRARLHGAVGAEETRIRILPPD